MKKRLAALLLLICIALQVSGCVFVRDEAIPQGYLRTEEYHDSDGMQDSIDYCKYFYGSDGRGKLFASGKYQEVNAEDVRLLQAYFEDFRNWMEATDQLERYDFETESINAGDLFFLRTKDGYPEFGYYSLYFFDCESNVLYYIRANI